MFLDIFSANTGFAPLFMFALLFRKLHLYSTKISILGAKPVLVFLGQFGIVEYVYLILFLLIFSFCGLIVTLKTNYVFSNHMNAIKKIIEKLHLSGYMVYPTAYSGSPIGKIIRVRYAFIGFYLIMILIWLYLLYQEIIIITSGG